MKLKSTFFGMALVACVIATNTQAATTAWDADGTGYPTVGGTGNWLGGNTWYDTTALSYGAWADGNNAVFEGTAGTVTVGAAGVSAADIAWNTTGYTLNLGGNLTMTSFSGSNIAGTTILNSSTSARSLTFNLASDATYTGIIRTSGTGVLTIIKQGASSTLTLGGGLEHVTTSTLALTVQGGTLKLSTTLNAGTLSTLAVSTGTTLDLNAKSITTTPAITAANLPAGSIITNSNVTAATLILGTGNNAPTLASDLTGNLGVTKTDSGTSSKLTLTGAVNITGSVNGARGLTLNNATSMVIGGTASTTNNGGITLSNNATIGALSMNGTGVLAIGANTLNLGSAVTNTTITTVSTGTGALNKVGASTLTLSGSNAFSGTTKITNGLLVLSQASGLALQNSIFDASNSITGTPTEGLKTTATTMTLGGLSGTKNLADVFTTVSGGYGALTALTLNPGAAATPSYSGIIADGAAGMTLTKGGTGTQTLSGANSYTGLTTINAGALVADVADVPGISGALGNGGNITFTGGTLQYTTNSAASDYSLRIKNSTSAIKLDTNGESVVLAGSFDNTNIGGLTKSGLGTLTLTASQAYTAITTVSVGTLALSGAGALTGNGAVTNAGTLDISAITGSTTSLGSIAGAGSLVLGGKNLTTGGNGTNTTYSGLISGSGGSLAKVGAGTLSLTGVANTYDGPTTIDNSILNAAKIAAGGATSSIGQSSNAASNLVFGGGTLQYNANTAAMNTDRLFTIGDAAGLSATIDSSSATNTNTLNFTNTGALAFGGSGARTLTLTGTNTNATGQTFAPLIGDGSGGGTALVKSGSNIWILTNAGNTYTGGTSINGGTLSVTSIGNQSATSSALGGAYSTINIGSGATGGTLLYTTTTGETTDRIINLAGTTGGTTIANNGTGNLNFNNTSGVTVTGAGVKTLGLAGTSGGTITLAGVIADSGGGATAVSTNNFMAGVLTNANHSFTGGITIGGKTSLSVPTISITGNNSGIGAGGPIAFNASSSGGATLKITGAGGTTDRSITIANTTGASTNGAVLDSSGSGAAIFTGGIAPSASSTSLVPSLTLTGSSASGIANEVSGVIADNGTRILSLTKSGSNTWTLSGANSYTGATTVAVGILKLGAAGDGTNSPLGTTAAGTSVTGGAALDLAGITLSTAEALTLNATGISSSGALFNSGAAATYSGLLKLGSAASIVSDNNITLTHTGTITGAGYGLTLSGTATGSSLASIIGTTSGNLTKDGVGTWTLSGASTYTGTTTVSRGTLVLGGNAPSGAIGVLGIASSEVVLGISAGHTDASILIGGAYSMDRNIRIPTNNAADNGTRTLSIGGNTANNSVFSGNIILGSSNNAGRGLTLTAANGGQVTISGVIQNPSSMDTTTYAVTKAGLGTVVLTNANTYTGNTKVASGLLVLSQASGQALKNSVLDTTNTITGTATDGLKTTVTTMTLGGLSGNQNLADTFTTASGGYNTVTALTLNPSGTPDYTGTIADGAPGMTLTKSGTGTQGLNGPNTYTGGTSITAGKLYVGHNSGLSTGSVDVTHATNSVQLILADGVVLPNSITMGTNLGLASNGLIAVALNTTATINGNINITGPVAGGGHYGGFADANAGTLILNGVITSTVAVKHRNGTVVYSGGGTGVANLMIMVGTAKLGANDGIPTTATIDGATSNPAWFDLAGFNQQIPGLTKGANAFTIGNSSTTADSTLTLTGSTTLAATSTFILQDVLGSGTRKLGLTVNGSGNTVTLSGANTYTGTTTIGGTSILVPNVADVVATSGALGNGGNITFTGGTLQYAAASAATDYSARIKNSSSAITLDTTTLNVSLANVIDSSNTGGLTKSGAGKLTLTADNTYSGSTTLSDGTLLVNNASGSGTGTGALTVGSAGALGGTGSIAGSVTINGGILSPGASVQSLAVGGDLTINTGSTFVYEMDSSVASALSADLQTVGGNLALNGTVNLTLSDLAGTPISFAAQTTTLSLINYVGSLNTGGFFTYNGNVLTDGEEFHALNNTWRITYDATSGGLNFVGDYLPGSKFINLTAIPEPASLFALACLVGTGTFLRSRRRSNV